MGIYEKNTTPKGEETIVVYCVKWLCTNDPWTVAECLNCIVFVPELFLTPWKEISEENSRWPPSKKTPNIREWVLTTGNNRTQQFHREDSKSTTEVDTQVDSWQVWNKVCPNKQTLVLFVLYRPRGNFMGKISMKFSIKFAWNFPEFRTANHRVLLMVSGGHQQSFIPPFSSPIASSSVTVHHHPALVIWTDAELMNCPHTDNTAIMHSQSLLSFHAPCISRITCSRLGPASGFFGGR